MALKIKVFGKVQGVFFRATTKSAADNLNLVGWVMNEPNGSVTIFAQGERQQELVEWAKQGPQFARVDRQEVEKVEDEDHQSFEIRR